MRGLLVALLVALALLAGATMHLLEQRRLRIDADERVEDVVYALRIVSERTEGDERALATLVDENEREAAIVRALERTAAEARERLVEAKNALARLRSEADQVRNEMDQQRGEVQRRVAEALETKTGITRRLRTLSEQVQQQQQETFALLQEIAGLRAQLSLPPQTERQARGLVNGVIVYVTNRNPENIAKLRASLTLLELNFLRCHPYPVVLFAERDVEDDVVKSLLELVPSATSATVERLCFDVCTPAGYPSHADVWKWLDKVGYGWPGYAAMCRFYSGTMYLHPALAQYDYYWRFDTDSYLTSRVPEDPFARMARDGCAYAYNNVQDDPPVVVQDLYPTVLDFLQTHTQGVQPPVDTNINPPLEYLAPIFPDPTLPSVTVEDVLRHNPPERLDGAVLWQSSFPLANVTRMKTMQGSDGNSYRRIIYWTNFEIAAFAPFRSQAWQAVFRAIDVARGFYQHRWGDAPVHALAVPLLLAPEQTCFMSSQRVPYSHRGEYIDHAESLLHADEGLRADVCKPPISASLPDLGGTASYQQFGK